jgi:hypothetical protein
MKTSANHSNPMIIMFWSMPSCSMLKDYKLKSDTLNQAIKEEKTIEVVTHGNKILKLKKIGIEAGKFFGIESIKGKMKKMLLNINDIKMVLLL